MVYEMKPPPFLIPLSPLWLCTGRYNSVDYGPCAVYSVPVTIL